MVEISERSCIYDGQTDSGWDRVYTANESFSFGYFDVHLLHCVMFGESLATM